MRDHLAVGTCEKGERAATLDEGRHGNGATRAENPYISHASRS
jgi:hypothetical protein